MTRTRQGCGLWLRHWGRELIDTRRTIVAVLGAVLISLARRLPEPDWAAITALIVMQSPWGRR